MLNRAHPKPTGNYPSVSFYGFDDAENASYSDGRPVVTCNPETGTYSETIAVSVSLHSFTTARYSIDGGSTWTDLSDDTDIYIYKDTQLDVEAVNGKGTTTVSHDYKLTSQENADTDGDGYPDCWEIFYGLNPLDGNITQDTDGDGITDIDEILRGSDPHVAGTLIDTDGDGWSDVDEGFRGTDPGDPNDTPVATGLYEVERLLSGSFYLDNGKTQTAADVGFDVATLESDLFISGIADGTGAYDTLRLPAGNPLLIRGNGDGSSVHSNFSVKRYIPFMNDLTPDSMPADMISVTDWDKIYADPSDWTYIFTKFLTNNLVVTETAFDVIPETIQPVSLLERELEILSGMGKGLFLFIGSLSNAVPTDSITELKQVLADRGQDMNDHIADIEAMLSDAETCVALKTDLDAVYPDTDGTGEKTTERKTAEILQEATGLYFAGLLISDSYGALTISAGTLGITVCSLLDPAGDVDGDGTDNADEVPDHSDGSGGDIFDIDSDDDGIQDGNDNCPSVHNPDQLDYDTDGMGDLCDNDIDNDGLDNGTELVFGSSSYTWDTDEDGISDYDEWAGYEEVDKPDNSRPLQPAINSPSEGATGIAANIIVTATAFADPDLVDGDYHGSSTWQIALDDGFTDLMFVKEGGTYLTSLPVSDLVLTANTLVYVRVKYTDRYGRESEWSETRSFTTAEATDDGSGNGIPDDQDVDDTVDLDGDTVADIEQPEDIKCVNTVVNNGVQICVKRDTNIAFIHTVVSVDPADIDDTQNRPDELPAGLIRMRLETETVGAEATVIVYFSKPLTAATSWFRFDEETGWEDYSANTSESNENHAMILTLKDGGIGDSDGVENGIIVTTGGIDTALDGQGSSDSNDTDDSGSSGGCFIQGVINESSRYWWQ